MVGWATKSEAAICLTCHRQLEFQWREATDGSRLEAVPPSRAVDFAPDGSRPESTWVNLQQRCRCGSFLGVEVELVRAAAEVVVEAKSEAG
jgi:hypothetical protein